MSALLPGQSSMGGTRNKLLSVREVGLGGGGEPLHVYSAVRINSFYQVYKHLGFGKGQKGANTKNDS